MKKKSKTEGRKLVCPACNMALTPAPFRARFPRVCSRCKKRWNVSTVSGKPEYTEIDRANRVLKEKPKSETQLVDVSAGEDFDVYIGRGRGIEYGERMRVDFEYTAPYMPHEGYSDWRDHAKREYLKLLRKWARNADVKKELLDLRGKKLGCWGEWGIEIGEVLVDFIGKLKE